MNCDFIDVIYWGHRINLFCLSVFISGILGGVVWGLGIVFGKKFSSDREKLRPFECGFSPKFNARLPFSIRFFLIALIFLIFDVELVLIFPLVLGLGVLTSFHIWILLIRILIILFLGLFHEWNQGRLDWTFLIGGWNSVKL